MQWIDLFVVLVLGGAVLKTFMYYKDPKRGGCHGSCSSCSQQCSYRENKTEINIRQKKY